MEPQATALGRLSESDALRVRPLLTRIRAAWNPRQIWLFGSRARGEARADSDWDVLVVVPDDLDEGAFDPVVGWRLQRDLPIRADVFPCRSTEFEEDRDTPNTLAYEAWHRGVLLDER
ncbi:MAG: nucleotidyltransferase domain-containing protein [Myxococcales bacterium]|nr:nucleotidyltransferase domain-containing protein [Myxococcales bacterium]